MSYLKIEYWNSVDLGEVLFQDGFKGRIYLDVELEKPDYNVTIESDVNGENKEIPKFRKWEKVFKFEHWMQEDLVDAFTFIQLCDNIEVTDQQGVTYFVDQMRVEPEWEEEGCLAKVTVTFTVDYVVAGACTENMESDCICTDYITFEGFTHISFIDSTTGTAGDYMIFYTATNIGGKRYTGQLYRLQTTGMYDWLLVTTDPGQCIYDAVLGYWYFDGTYWELMPGFVATAIYAAPNLTVTGWAPDGTFVTVWINNGPAGAWVDYGDYVAQDLDAGIVLSIGTSGTFDVKLEVWNHSCDYSFTEEYEFIIP